MSLLMMMLMLWLAVSAPLVQAAQKKAHSQQVNSSTQTDEEESMPPSSEQKSQCSTTGIFEYLHTHHIMEFQSVTALKSFLLHHEESYKAFHPEMVSPPPKA